MRPKDGFLIHSIYQGCFFAFPLREKLSGKLESRDYVPHPQLIQELGKTDFFYEIDVLKCPRCRGRMSVIAVIRNPQAIV